MSYSIMKNGKEITYLDKKDLAISLLKCPRCESTISVKSSAKWISLKCKCQVALVYPESYLEGRLPVIPLEQHLEKKEME